MLWRDLSLYCKSLTIFTKSWSEAVRCDQALWKSVKTKQLGQTEYEKDT